MLSGLHILIVICHEKFREYVLEPFFTLCTNVQTRQRKEICDICASFNTSVVFVFFPESYHSGS